MATLLSRLSFWLKCRPLTPTELHVTEYFQSRSLKTYKLKLVFFTISNQIHLSDLPDKILLLTFKQWNLIDCCICACSLINTRLLNIDEVCFYLKKTKMIKAKIINEQCPMDMNPLPTALKLIPILQNLWFESFFSRLFALLIQMFVHIHFTFLLCKS